MRIIYRMRGKDNFFDQIQGKQTSRNGLLYDRKDNISLVVVYFELVSI